MPRALALFLAGAVAASVNAAAGGGTLLTFPALLAAGLSPLTANATSTVALVWGSLASVWGYRPELRAQPHRVALLLGPSIVGGALGAWLLLRLGAESFARCVPWLLLGGALLLLLQPAVASWLRRRGTHRDRPLWAVVAGLLVSLYAGYFGAGAGILALGALGLFLVQPFEQLNALKVLIASVANGLAALTFLGLEWLHPTGSISWGCAVPLGAGAVFGGYVGVGLVRRIPAPALRALAAAVGIGIALWLLIRRGALAA